MHIEHNYKDNVKNVYIYRIPLTLAVAYNETHLFDNIKTGMSYIYSILECKDIFVVIAKHLFELVSRDFSLYTRANKID